MTNCQSCKYHLPLGKNAEDIMVGYCYRNPPTPISKETSTVPCVSSEKGWCAKFARRWQFWK